MGKLKTKSSAKKRFRFTATGKVKAPQAGKRHGMIKRTNKQIRTLRGMTILSKQDSKIIKSYMPYYGGAWLAGASPLSETERRLFRGGSAMHGAAHDARRTPLPLPLCRAIATPDADARALHGGSHGEHGSRTDRSRTW